METNEIHLQSDGAQSVPLQKRFFMTVVGIAGCTALLVTGFGLHDSISDIVYKQFGEVFTYDVSISLKTKAR